MNYIDKNIKTIGIIIAKDIPFLENINYTLLKINFTFLNKCAIIINQFEVKK